jgi:hypothetical protein
MPFAARAANRVHLAALSFSFYLLLVVLFVLTARLWFRWRNLRRRTPEDALKAGLL